MVYPLLLLSKILILFVAVVPVFWANPINRPPLPIVAGLVPANKNSSNKTDGFWDPNFVAERSLGKVFDRYKADEMGPNLEWGGTPYPYKTRERTFFFKPVEEKK